MPKLHVLYTYILLNITICSLVFSCHQSADVTQVTAIYTTDYHQDIQTLMQEHFKIDITTTPLSVKNLKNQIASKPLIDKFRLEYRLHDQQKSCNLSKCNDLKTQLINLCQKVRNVSCATKSEAATISACTDIGLLKFILNALPKARGLCTISVVRLALTHQVRSLEKQQEITENPIPVEKKSSIATTTFQPTAPTLNSETALENSVFLLERLTIATQTYNSLAEQQSALARQLETHTLDSEQIEKAKTTIATIELTKSDSRENIIKPTSEKLLEKSEFYAQQETYIITKINKLENKLTGTQYSDEETITKQLEQLKQELTQLQEKQRRSRTAKTVIAKQQLTAKLVAKKS